MKCRVTLSDDYVIDNTSLSWRTKSYKPYRAQMLFDTERARLPGTQLAAEQYKKALAMSKQCSELVKAIQSDFKAKTAGLDETSLDFLEISWKNEADLIVPHRTISACRPVISSMGLRSWTGFDTKSETRTVLKACITTGCAGFLKEDFSCGLCLVQVCKGCHEVKAMNHECNADTVATIKALKAEAKGCPKCATLISKIDGCDQMWCTQCHTTFSWRTGQIEVGHTHNPHYYQWARAHGGLPRNPGDQACGGFPRLSDVLNVVQEVNEQITYIHRLFIHVEETIRRRLNTQVPDNHELRVKYLIQELDMNKFKTRLQEVDKAYRKSVAKNQVYQMAYTVAGDLFRKLINDGDVKEAKMALTNLMDYSNKCLNRIATAYTCKVIHYELN